MDKEQRKHLISNSFHNLFDAEPILWVRSPGRVDLMGSHTDYNQGYVLTEAINRDTWIAARPRKDQTVRICSLNMQGCGEFNLNHIDHDQEVFWTDYVRGVVSIIQQEGYPLSGFDGLIHSNLPTGSGLGSSAALEISIAVLLNHMCDLDIDRVELAKLCQLAENQFVEMNCGILDQYSSIMGEAGCSLLLDCREITSVSKPIAEEVAVVICNTNAKRELTGTEYSERRAQCEHGVRLLAEKLPGIHALRDVSLEQYDDYIELLPEIVAKRCRFIIEENQRVLDIADALAKRDFRQISKLTAASYHGALYLYEIISHEMEIMMEAMLDSPGVIGARQAGAGFGGCMVAFVDTKYVDLFNQHVHEKYYDKSGIVTEIYVSHASQGASLLPF